MILDIFIKKLFIRMIKSIYRRDNNNLGGLGEEEREGEKAKKFLILYAESKFIK